MSKIFYFFIFFPLSAISQKEDDNLILVTVSDTNQLYERVRQAITYTDFIIREDSGRDTLRTYSERIGRTTMFVVAKIVIVGNKVEISGAVGLGSQDFWGDPGWPKSFKRISYYNKGSEEWWRMRSIALKLDGKIEYTKR
ncbi:MAG TPA: hypothetical protein VFZ33_11140 [Chitinophagaceae bacterium]